MQLSKLEQTSIMLMQGIIAYRGEEYASPTRAVAKAKELLECVEIEEGKENLVSKLSEYDWVCNEDLNNMTLEDARIFNKSNNTGQDFIAIDDFINDYGLKPEGD